MSKEAQRYIHGVDAHEQRRLARLNALTNSPFIEFLELKPNQLVLEVGSGIGLLASQVEEAEDGATVVGIEYSAEQLARAKLAGHSSGRLRFAQADAHALPLEDNCFDIVYCRYVLEHVRNPEAVVGEMRRVLKPGGRMHIQENDTHLTVFDPDCPAADNIIDRFIELQLILGGDGRVGKRLFGLMQRAGMQNIRISLQPELHTSGMASYSVWVENLISIIRGAAAGLIEHSLASRPEVDNAIGELLTLLARPDGSALFHWNRACGIK